MKDHTDLPLFSGTPAAEAPSQKRRRTRTKPAPRPAQAGPRVVALPLARNRHLVADLVSMFRATPPGPNRAAAFRRDVLTPLVSQRLTLGLTAAQLDHELYALEEAMVRVLMGAEQAVGVAR
ncbi:hypothetical protein [Methylobacterium sp. P1-11]|uniref:hypothetical protein n=1 Tax=Methylobacterium sp. P1-11 TaxID=2024616 RepID=UPI0011ECB591|nr:hypothetical protein [Methylobacterium sp. P1-11]